MAKPLGEGGTGRYADSMTKLRTLGALVLGSTAFVLATLAAGAGASAPPTAAVDPNNPPPNGPRMVETAYHAITNVTVHPKPGETLEHATIVVRDGRIVSVQGTPAAPKAETKPDAPKPATEIAAATPAAPEPAAPPAPAGARVWDGTGLHVYPGMIDPYVEVDAPRPDANQPGVHWNRRVTPQRRAVDGALDEGTNKRLRDMGFVAAHIVPRGGIFRGSSAVVSLAEAPPVRSGPRTPIYREDLVQAVAFDTSGVGGEGTGGAALDRWDEYPGSEMGAIALVRQTLHDAEWRSQGRSALSGSDARSKQAHEMGFDEPAAIDLLAKRDGGPALMWVVDDELDILRAEKVAREFKRTDSIYVGMGTEYQRLDAIKDRLKSGGGGGGGNWLIVPLSYPDDPKAESIGAAAEIELRTLMEWEQAPANAKRLNDAGIKFALTTGRIPDRRGGRGKFIENLRTAVRHGLPEDRAIALVTTEPAALLGVDKDLGTVEAGKIASFVVTDGPLLDKKTKVRDVWVDGRRHEVNVAPTKLEGEYDITIEPGPKTPGTLTMSIDKDNGITLKKVLPPEEPKPADAKPADAKPEDAKEEPKPADAKPAEPAKPESPSAEKATWPAERRTPEGDALKQKAIERIRALIAEGKHDEAIKLAIDSKLLDPTSGQLVSDLLKDAPAAANDKPAADKPAEKPKSDKPEKPKDKTARPKNVKIDGKAGTISFVFDHEPFGEPGMFTVSGAFERDPVTKTGWVFSGEATRADGTPFRWSAKPAAKKTDAEKKDAEKKDDDKDKKPDADKKDDKPAPPADDGVSGTWTLKVTGGQIPAGQDHPVTLTLKLEGDTKVAATLAGPMGEATISDATYDKAAGTVKGSVAFGQGPPGTMTLTLKDGALTGTSLIADAQYQLTGTRTSKPEGRADAKGEDDEDKPVTVPDLPGYPFGPFAIKELPPQGTIVITNATVWTCGPAGKIENGVVIASNGKISYVGPAGGAPALPVGADVRQIDAKGKHVTPGLIDCHSHTGISRGVNESGQAVTAEVRIQDVLNPDAMNWYRQLAGGLTCVNNLHGSANPIGGQNAVNKIRWGVANPDDMHFSGADAYSDDNPFAVGARKSTTTPGIKFALGENVKQSNWGEQSTSRYPQTRMGVETLIKDRFTAAKEYAAGWDAYAKDSSGLAPRRDLELEALAELLRGGRLIHCHSYRQDEILMLARLTRDFGFKLGTYQHNLEGYKVADAVKDSSIGASIFSDWWAYKIEVQDAIPYAGSIMHDQGVVVSFNSDSDELARRMNYEAAKAVKYGGVKPEEALKFVTINPAKQLKIDDRVGSLEAGKDADIALWSGDPLSAFTRCEATWVDGREMFSLEADAKMRARDAADRQRLIQKALGAGKSKPKGDGGGGEAGSGPGGPPAGGGAPGDAPRRRGRPPQDDVMDEVARSGRSSLIYTSVVNADAIRREYYMSLLKRGINPEDAGHIRGDCGCDVGLMDWMRGESGGW